MSHNPSFSADSPAEAGQRDLGVLVGFDGSDHAVAALDYATEIALKRKVPLTVATAYKVPIMVYPNLASMPKEPDSETQHHAAEAILAQAQKHLTDYPGRIRYLTVRGDSVGALVEVSSRAELTVVGARGRGGFIGRILGSVASALPAHAHCQTIVLPVPEDVEEQADLEATMAGDDTTARDTVVTDAATGDAAAGAPDASSGPDTGTGDSAATDAAAGAADLDESAPVLVGIDGSGHSRSAVLRAAEFAAEHGADLHLLLALPPLDDPLVWYPELVADVTGMTAKRRSELDEALRTEIGWVTGHFPGLHVNGSVRVGDPVEVLVESAMRARLVAVGSRGRGAVRSVLLGSTSRSLLHRAPVPVMVVPWAEDARLENQPHFG